MMPQIRDMTEQCKNCLGYFFELNKDGLCPECARISVSLKPLCAGLAEFVCEEEDWDEFLSEG